MSAGTLLLGLVLALFLAPGSEVATFGWVLAVVGAIGLGLRYVIPMDREQR